MTDEQIRFEIAVYETKASWCDERGYPSDAAQHRAYSMQLPRSLTEAQNYPLSE